MKNLLEKTRCINELLQQNNTITDDSPLPYNQMAIILGDILDSNTYIIDASGTILGFHEKNTVNNQRMQKMLEEQQLPESYAKNVQQVYQTKVNIEIGNDLTIFPVEARKSSPSGLTSIIPIYGAGKRLGTFLLGRIGLPFDDDELVLVEYSATVVGMEILYQQSRKIEAEIRSASAIQMAMNTLSYSELKAVKAIFKALGAEEGRLTASNIADEIGITRSVIVNALRKLESAGIIESRSLGMKGTYIKIINKEFLPALEKETLV